MWEVANREISVLFIYKLVLYIKKFCSSIKLTTSNAFRLLNYKRRLIK